MYCIIFIGGNPYYYIRRVNRFMKFTRIIALAMSVFMVLLVFASCGDGSDTTTSSETKPGDISDVWIPDGLGEDLDFGGEKIRILSRSEDWFYDELQVERDEVVNVIDESVFNREGYVEERLGIEMMAEKIARGSDGLSTITNITRQNFQSALDTYDIVAGSCYHLQPLTTESMMYDLTEVENIDLDQPWYAQNFIDLATINDQLMFVTGDAALSLMRLTFVTFVNMDIASTYGCSNIYEIVNNKQWTLDYQSTLVSNVYEDLNGNSTADEEDLYGLTMSVGAGVDLYWSAFDMQILTNDSADGLTISMDQEKVGEAVVKLCDLHHDNPGVFAQPTNEDLEYETIKQRFASGQRLFANIHLISVESEFFINMEAVYGIIPAPLWNEDQEDYYSYVHDQYTVFGIPGTVSDDKLPAVGAFLEATSNYSYNDTRDVYFEIALKGRYARDEQSRVMLDKIINSIKIDAGWIYSGCLNNFANEFRNLVKGNNRNWSSTYRAKGKILENYLGKLNDNYGPVQ